MCIHLYIYIWYWIEGIDDMSNELSLTNDYYDIDDMSICSSPVSGDAFDILRLNIGLYYDP